MRIFASGCISAGATGASIVDQGLAEKFLLNQIPPALQAKIPQTLKNAYAAAYRHMESDPFLMVPSAADNRGRVISWAVDFGMQKLVESGQWPFDCRWQHFERPTGRYLEIIAPYSTITISQVSDPTKQPRDVGFRSNLRLAAQKSFALPEFAADNETCGVPHILLLHGHQSLDFIHLAVPHSRHSAGYIYRSPNILHMPHEVDTPHPPAEQTDFEEVMSLKLEIDKWRHDNG
jgi:hypothetical protein